MTEMDLSKIKVLYLDLNMQLYGIPYDMRPGQSPTDLRRAVLAWQPPPYGTYGSKQVDLSDWIWLGSPGWYGSMSRTDQEQVKVFLARWRNAIPGFPGEWTRLADFP